MGSKKGILIESSDSLFSSVDQLTLYVKLIGYFSFFGKSVIDLFDFGISYARAREYAHGLFNNTK